MTITGARSHLPPAFFERADEFLFLGVDADDRCVLDGAARAQFGDVLELVVAVRMRGASTLLVVDPQRESHLLEEPGDGPRADVGTELAQFGGDLGGRAAGPLQAAERVAGRLVVHQGFDVGDDFRRFFRRRTPAACAPHPVYFDVALDELPPAGGDRRRVDAEQLGDAPVAAPPALERFEAGEQTPLPLVEQAGEQHDRGAQFLRHQVGLWQGPYESGRGHQQAPRAQLVRLVRAVGRAVEELAGEPVPRQPPVADELAQRGPGCRQRAGCPTRRRSVLPRRG